jgi:hypothetical protein
VGYEVVAGEGKGLVLVLRYRIRRAVWFGLQLPWSPGAEGEYELRIRLGVTRTPRGQPRWWARCPLAVGGRACGRRVLHLYLPSGARYFGCRACHRLTYQACPESHKRRSEWEEVLRSLPLGGPRARPRMNRSLELEDSTPEAVPPPICGRPDAPGTIPCG